VGVLGGSMIFRAVPVKFKTTLVKQNKKLVHKCGFRFYWRGAEHVKLLDLSSEIEVLGPRIEKSRFPFGLFRGVHLQSETAFVNQLSILFHECGLRFYWCGAEDHKNPATYSFSPGRWCFGAKDISGFKLTYGGSTLES